MDEINGVAGLGQLACHAPHFGPVEQGSTRAMQD